MVPVARQDVSQAEPPLLIEQLTQLALANNPTLCLAARRVQALRGKQQQVGLYPNPTMGYIGEEIGNEGHGGQHGIRLGQQVVTAGKLAWNQSVVGSEIATAEHEWAMQRLRVVNDVRAAAYEVMAAQQTVELSEELLQVAEAGLKSAEQMLAAQEVSRIDVLEARIEVTNTRLALRKAHFALTDAWRRLVVLAGVPDMPPTRVADPEADRLDGPIEWETALHRLISESPERMRAMAKVERARAAVGRECAGRVPDVELEAGVRYNFGSDSTLATMGFALPLQIFDRNQGNIYRAQAELAAAHQDLRRVELLLQERLAQEFRRHDDARETVGQYRDALLPDAGDALQLARAGYQQGEFSYLEVLTVQRTYFETHLAFVDAIREARVSRVRIEGLLLTGGLESPGPVE
ncbi:MAG: TolC family protein [Patescibacteria group bacterium]|nr:TolC family protein [Patescibacteria group bacterium]